MSAWAEVEAGPVSVPVVVQEPATEQVEGGEGTEEERPPRRGKVWR